MTTGTEAFWIDRADDCERASDGRSRYGAYVRMNATAFTETAALFDAGSDLARVAFAVEAWRVATGPVMAPPLVRSHHRVVGALVHRSHRDGSAVAEVELVAPWPPSLRSSRDWHGSCRWSDWPTTPAGWFFEPEATEVDISARSYLLTIVKALFTVDVHLLPDPSLDALERSADAAVTVLVAQLNAVVTPILQHLEQS